MRAPRGLVFAFPAFLFVAGVAWGQSLARPWRIGVLSSRTSSASAERDLWGQLPLGLRELGYIEGKNITIEWRFASGDYKRLSDLAAELVRFPVDIILTDGTPPTVAAQKATTTIPIVFASVGDAVGVGLVKGLAHPGGNVTGVSILLGELIAKQVEMLTATVPRLTRVAMLQNPTNPSSPLNLDAFRRAAATARLQVVAANASKPEEIETAFSTMIDAGVGAFVMDREAMLIQERVRIARLAARNHLPWIAGQIACVEAGGLMSYGPSNALTYRRIATYVDKILKGANPGDLPVEQPTKFELAVNRKTARALGLTIPADLLVLADKVID